MTNFEKWKSELTPEHVWKVFCGYRDDCVFCPTPENCKDGNRCHEEFLHWANKEVEK